MGLYEQFGAREPKQPDYSGLFREMGNSAEGEETAVRGGNRTTHGGRNLAHWTTKRRCSVYVHRYSVFFPGGVIFAMRKSLSHGAGRHAIAVTRNVNNFGFHCNF